MTNLTNLDRDMKWLIQVTPEAIGTDDPLTGNPTIQTDATVYETHGLVVCAPANLAGASGQHYFYGVKIQWITEESVDYIPCRIKGWSTADGTVYGVGWSNAGTNGVTLSDIRYLACGKIVDDVWNIVRPAALGDDYFPVFFVAPPADSGVHVGGLGVQRMLSKPSRYTTGVR